MNVKNRTLLIVILVTLALSGFLLHEGISHFNEELAHAVHEQEQLIDGITNDIKQYSFDFAVGENGVIVHFDGTAWRSMNSGTTATLQAIWGSTGSDVFAVGADGLILYYNGANWYSVPTTATQGLNGVWVSDRSDFFAVGENGAVVFGKGEFPWLPTSQNTTQVNAMHKTVHAEENVQNN